MGNNRKNFIEYLQLPIRIIFVFYLLLKSTLSFASGVQGGAFWKNCPPGPVKHPQKFLLNTDIPGHIFYFIDRLHYH